jgi:hypothetical protein
MQLTDQLEYLPSWTLLIPGAYTAVYILAAVIYPDGYYMPPYREFCDRPPTIISAAPLPLFCIVRVHGNISSYSVHILLSTAYHAHMPYVQRRETPVKPQKAMGDALLYSAICVYVRMSVTECDIEPGPLCSYWVVHAVPARRDIWGLITLYSTFMVSCVEHKTVFF